MSLPIGFRVVGVLCILSGLPVSGCVGLAGLGGFAHGHTPRPLLIVMGIVVGLAGVGSLVAGCCLFMKTKLAWARAGAALDLAAICYMVFLIHELIASHLDGYPLTDFKILVVVWMTWITILLSTAARLGSYTREIDR